MQISIGNADQVTAMVDLCREVISRLRENGALDELADNIMYVRKLVHASTTAQDVAAYGFYREAGMSSEEAVLLLISNRLSKEDVGELLKKTLRAKTQ